jgi:ElaB/YqjD/DUF883 family membrane-anchored ribosome-binding protein
MRVTHAQEAAMRDWELILEQFQAAMQAVDKAHEATETLREKADREALEKFQTEMRALYERLEQMQQILAHEDMYLEDELVEAMGAALGAPSGYHHIPHYDIEPKK